MSVKSISTRAHDHVLALKNATEFYASRGIQGWTCDACKRNLVELRQNHSYQCTSCNFDLCKQCPKPVQSKKHEHQLSIINAVEHYSDGGWICDNCGSKSEDEGPISWHCEKKCAFDLCYGCTKDHKSSAHPAHKLKKTNPRDLGYIGGRWGCDICKEEFEITDIPYNCKKCSYDLCGKCMKATAVIDEDVDNIQKKIKKDLNFTDGKKNGPAQIFISYQWDIQENVLALKEELEANNITCWMDVGQLNGGDCLKTAMADGIKNCKMFISCVTTAYTKSKVCIQEVSLADVLKKPILPILFESITWPPEGPMAMAFAPLLYVNCVEENSSSVRFKDVVKTVKTKKSV